MHLDVDTLFVVEAFVSFLTAGFLALAWWYYRSTNAPLLWCFSNLATGVGLVLIEAQSVLPAPMMPVSIAFFALGTTLIWGAARQFNGRPAYLTIILAGPVIWLVASQILQVFESPRLLSIVSSAIFVTYLVAAILELLRDRGEHLFARWPLIGLIGIHAGLFAASIVDIILGAPAHGDLSFGTVFSLIHFEHLIVTIGTAIFLIAMIKERSEAHHKTAASQDSLTGLASRRAFLDEAELALEHHLANKSQVSVLLFDLDEFKAINDNWGHAIGDRILEVFGSVTRNSIRRGDLAGRIGGEEFSVVLREATEDVGFAFAERIRTAFLRTCSSLPDTPVHATVSVGVAASGRDDISLSKLLRLADIALYEAKSRGRNRTELASEGPDRTNNIVVRIA